MKSSRAFSIVELLVIVLFVGLMAAVAVPRINFAGITRQKADTLAHRIVTDMRRTRTMAIAHAVDSPQGFMLRMTGSSPYSGYEIVNLANSQIVDSLAIYAGIQCTGGSQFKFGPLGNLLTGSDSSLTVTSSPRTFSITILSATGFIKCVEN